MVPPHEAYQEVPAKEKVATGKFDALKFIAKRCVYKYMAGYAPSPSRRSLILAELGRKKIDVFSLGIAQSNYYSPEIVNEECKKAIDQRYTHYETTCYGLPELREVIVEKLKEYNNIEADPNQIVITSANTQASFASYMITINPGDEVIFTDPAYPHFNKVEFAGGKVIGVPISEEKDYRIERDELERRITSKTKMISICDPLNPVGRVFTRKELSVIADLAIEYDLLVHTDEAYEHCVFDNRKHYSIASLPEMFERTISTFTFSKDYAMDGWRLGYAVANNQFAWKILGIVEVTVSTINTFIQKAAVTAIRDSSSYLDEMNQDYQKRRDYAVKRISEIQGMSCFKPEGTFMIFPDISKTEPSAEVFSDYLLREAHVLSLPGHMFGKEGRGHLRLVLGGEPMDRLEKAFDNIEMAVKKYRKRKRPVKGYRYAGS